MQAILSVMREERRTADEYEQTLADLAEEADRLRTLVEDLLSLARSDRQGALAHERVELTPLLDSVTEALRPLVENKGLTLRGEIDPGLVIQGDEDALIRVFVNLLDNAVKYTDHGEIAVGAHHYGAVTQVAVSDTGVGIPAEHLPHIFERFYRVDASRSGNGVVWAWPLRKTLFELTAAPSRSAVSREPARYSPSVSHNMKDSSRSFHAPFISPH